MTQLLESQAPHHSSISFPPSPPFRSPLRDVGSGARAVVTVVGVSQWSFRDHSNPLSACAHAHL